MDDQILLTIVNINKFNHKYWSKIILTSTLLPLKHLTGLLFDPSPKFDFPILIASLSMSVRKIT